MRRLRSRLTVRGVMVVVALVAIPLGVTQEVGRLRRRSMLLNRQAVLSGRELREWQDALAGRTAAESEARRLSAGLSARDPDLARGWAWEASGCAREVRNAQEFIAYFAARRAKYRRAASRPWEPVAPDPPEPRAVHVWRCTLLPKEPLPPGERWYAEPE